MNGIGGEKSVAEGIALLEKAADMGHLESLNTLGSIYVNGQIVKQNYAKARGYLSKAAE